MPDDDRLHLACPDCQRAIRVPANRLQDGPRCPACHTALLRNTPIELDDTNFATFIARNDLPVLVDFWAPWCGPCRQYGPVIAEAAARYCGHVIVVKVNSDAAPNVSTRYGIRSIPSTLLFRGGAEIARQSGAMPLPTLTQWMATQLGGSAA